MGHLSDDNNDVTLDSQIVPNMLLSLVLSQLIYRCQNYSMGPKLERHIHNGSNMSQIRLSFNGGWTVTVVKFRLTKLRIFTALLRPTICM